MGRLPGPAATGLAGAAAPSRRPMWRDEGGAVAIEFAFIAGMFVILLLNGVDLGHYLYLREQVENAAQAGAHAVWVECDPSELPALSKCSNADDPDSDWREVAMSAVFRTLHGTDTDTTAKEDVTLSSLVEGYHCPTSGGVLIAVADPKNPPGTCMTGATPGLYIQLQVTYKYTPIFGDLSFTRAFGTSIAKTSFMRLQ